MYHSGNPYGYGGTSSYSGYSYTAPTYGIVDVLRFQTNDYGRYFKMVMFDTANSHGTNLRVVYEGTVVSRGRSAAFREVSGCMINALFSAFPGGNGQVTTVSANAYECAR